MFEVLQKIKSGLNLDEATSHLEDEDANQLSVSFSRWVQKEILISALERPVQ